MDRSRLLPAAMASLSRTSRRLARGVLALAAALPLFACKGKGASPLAKAEPGGDSFAHVPVPAADALKIVAVAPTPVFDRPSLAATKIGELRAGAIVSRSVEPYAKGDCPGGYYAVRPRGFVCAGATASLDLTQITRGLPVGPDLTRALPYRYARAHYENVAVYTRAPSPAEQLAAEPDLKHFHARAHGESDALGAATNDVPLDARGVPTGPPVLLPGGEGIENGRRSTAAFFTFGFETRPPSFLPATEAVKAGGMRKGTGLAITASVELESISGLRRFGVTTGGQLVPVDHLRPALGSTWHGIDLEKTGLPVAFVFKQGACPYTLAKGKATKQEDEIERRTAVPLTGKFRTVEGVRFEETRDGAWLRTSDLLVVVKRHKFPDIAKGTQKWIDVSIATQTLTAYEGTKPVYATLISTGRDQLRDPAATASTPRGLFRIVNRHAARTLEAREAGNAFEVADAPWVLDVEAVGTEPAPVKNFSLFGAFWADVVGEASTFHDVALTPLDAHRLWTWNGGDMPEGWASVYGQEDGPYVFVRP